ncbi:MAG: helix-turn-helix domain-containing protein [Leadbetterella sp.]
MAFDSKFLFFFSALGAFNGILLSAYFIFFTSKKHLSNYLLGALLLVLSIRVGKSVVYYFDKNLPKIYLQIGLSACFLIGPFLYFFIKSEIEQIKKIPKSWVLTIAFWVAAIASIGFVFPYQISPKAWWHYIVYGIYTQWGIHIVFSGFLLLPTLKKIFKKETIKPYEKWHLTIWGGILILFFCYVWSILNITKGSYIMGGIGFSMILYSIVFVLIFRKKADDLSSFSSQKYNDKKLSQEDVQAISIRLEEVMKTKELFKNPNLKLNDLAKEIHVSGHQLSQFLNDNLDKNFTLFINEYRIKAACQALSSKSNLTIEAIADEVGFNSKSTFFTAFKKIMGTTPTGYQQNTLS